MRKYDPQQHQDYRRNELHPDVFALFEKARNERYQVVIPKMIDNAISIQENRSVYTACNYVRYLLLHELSWYDVFGRQAVEFDKQLEHYQQCRELEEKVDSLQETVNTMTMQMEQMQIVLMNMANMLINPGKVRKTA